MSRLRRGLAAVVLPSLVALAAGCSPPAESEAAAPVPEPAAELAPEFELARLDGSGPVSLSALRGKTVVLDFWATWCPPCEFQVPELNRFFEAHRSDGDVVVFGISVDTEGPEVVRAWAAEKDVRYPILIGGEDLARKYGAVGFPTLYVVSPEGELRERHVGLIEAETLEAALAMERGAESS